MISRPIVVTIVVLLSCVASLQATTPVTISLVHPLVAREVRFALTEVHQDPNNLVLVWIGTTTLVTEPGKEAISNFIEVRIKPPAAPPGFTTYVVLVEQGLGLFTHPGSLILQGEKALVEFLAGHFLPDRKATQ